MNSKLVAFARADLKKTLPQCTADQQLLFKKMYAKGKLDMDIGDVVDKIKVEELSWAMEQVDKTIAKNAVETMECPDCGGYGDVPYSIDGGEASWELCERCQGTGSVPKPEKEVDNSEKKADDDDAMDRDKAKH